MGLPYRKGKFRVLFYGDSYVLQMLIIERRRKIETSLRCNLLYEMNNRECGFLRLRGEIFG